jgi:transcriptional regulator with XRE-family HTH domain
LSNSESTGKNSAGNSFAERLAELMAAHGLTQKQLGTAIDVAQASVFKWLNGTLPRSGELCRLAKHFGVPMEWLLEGVRAVDISPSAITQTHPMSWSAEYLKALVARHGLTPDQFIEVAKRLAAPRLESNLLVDNKASTDSVHPVTLVSLDWEHLIDRVRRLTLKSGAKARLAREVNVSRQMVHKWLTKDKKLAGKASADVTLSLQNWVIREEQAKLKSSQGASTPGEPKTQSKGSSSNETTRPGRKKK